MSIAALPHATHAEEYIWSGDSRGDVNWSNGDNWGGVVPVSHPSTHIIFDEGALISAPHQDISAAFGAGFTWGSLVVRF